LKCYPKSPLYTPHTQLPNPPTKRFLALAFPYTGESYNLHRTKGFSFQWWRLGHLLLHMQLETRALGALVSSYRCSAAISPEFIEKWTLHLPCIRNQMYHTNLSSHWFVIYLQTQLRKRGKKITEISHFRRQSEITRNIFPLIV
jgi:hypothetical protein